MPLVKKMKIGRKKIAVIITVIAVVIVLTVSVLLYLGLTKQLNAERMYSAVGGEGFVPGLVAAVMLWLIHRGVYLPLMEWAEE